MKCPKCGGEIPFYNLKPNCKHCGVNIYYYSQDALLMRDAKRTELEAAAARMVIVRIKASFIGGGLQIARMVFVLISVAALLLPFGGAVFRVPFFEGSLSAGLIGAIQAFQNGLLLKTPQLLQSALFSKQALAATVDFGCLLLVAVIDVIMLVFYILSFFNLTNSTKRMRNLSLVGVAVSLLGFAVPLVMKLITPDSALASVSFGFGGLLCAAMFLVQFFLNRAILKKGIEPTYREFDPKRRELLHQVRRGEVDIDSLPLPIYESKEEHEERMKALALPNGHGEG